MPQRKYSKTKIESIKQTKRITLPIDLDAYNEIRHDKQAFRQYLDEMIQSYPELFPDGIGQGYKLHGLMPASQKMPRVQLRRIQLTVREAQGQRQVFTIAPCDILPYMAGEVTEVEKALFLRRFGVPFWALTYVFGRNDIYWYRLVGSLGRHDIVGTTVTIIQCFLHAFLKVRSCGQRLGPTFAEIKRQVWDIYHAVSRADFRQKVSQLQEWTRSHADDLTAPVIEAIDKLCTKADSFMLTFDYPEAYRTSNMVDRHMEPMAGWLYSARYFHGHWLSAELHTRAWALLHNFWPYCPRAKVHQAYQSPAHKLNGFIYRDNWLENLLVATSLQGFHVSNK